MITVTVYQSQSDSQLSATEVLVHQGECHLVTGHLKSMLVIGECLVDRWTVVKGALYRIQILC